MILVKPSYEIWTPKEHLDHMILNIERAGRKCYKSDDKICEGSAEPFIRGIVKRQHLSVVEHSLLTVCFTVDRGVSHELVRHRLCSFSQESTRYVNYGKKGHCTFVIPQWCGFAAGEYTKASELYSYHSDYKKALADHKWIEAIQQAESRYLELLELGWTPQQARSVLPNSTKTEIVVSTNFREWQWIFHERHKSPPAHPQIAEVINPLLEDMAKQLPVIFGQEPT